MAGGRHREGEPADHDFRVGLVVTPTAVIRTGARRRPGRIDWSELDQIAAIPASPTSAPRTEPQAAGAARTSSMAGGEPGRGSGTARTPTARIRAGPHHPAASCRRHGAHGRTFRHWLRIAELVARYDDLPLGTVDASVVAAAERLGAGAIATFDRRHFTVVRPIGGPFTLLPEC